MNSDVRDILELSESQKTQKPKVAKKKKIKRLIEPAKRPQGVHREVWGLICKDDRLDQPPLIPTNQPKVYMHPKAKLRYGVRKWHWIPFKNPARTDSVMFSHWRCMNDDPNKEYPFAKYNKHVQLCKYTDTEYTQHLSDDSWSRLETDYLFELCKRYDLRFFVIHDRWDPKIVPELKSRSIDELKDRYYKVTGIMQKLKNSALDDSQIYTFDLEHEQKRREQLEKLFSRSKEQIDEELYLMEELKKIEIRKKERERKQQDVNKLLTAVVDLENTKKQHQQNPSIKALPNSPVTNSNPKNPNDKRFKHRKSINQIIAMNESAASGQKSDGNNQVANSNTGSSQPKQNSNSQNNSLNNSMDATQTSSALSPSSTNIKEKKSLIFKAVVESTGIKFPDNKVTGVSLRSFRMKLPPSVGQKKTKAIDQLIEELQVDPHPIATESLCEQFNELRSDIVLLYELQQALTNCEFELQTLRHRYEPAFTARNIDTSIFDMSLSSSQSSLITSMSASTTNTPPKRISEIFDVSLSPSLSLERRRKAALNQTNILKRLRGRNAT